MRIIAYLLIILSLSSCDYVRMARIAYRFHVPIDKNTNKKFNTSQKHSGVKIYPVLPQEIIIDTIFMPK